MRVGEGKGLQARAEKKDNRMWWWICLKHMI